MDKSITYVGLDVHKDTIAVALAEAGAQKDVREYGKIANTAMALNALAAKLSRAGSELRFCYEAGPCGYGIQRQLSLAGHGCVVVAPSLIPRKPGDRIKTDRRENHPPWSRPRSLENWRVLPGRSPSMFRPPPLDALRSTADITKRRSSPTTHLSKAEQGWRHGHGQENPRVHYQPDIFRRWRLDRGSSATHHRSGGIQPAHQSMINRRFDDRASCPAQSRPF